MFNNGTSGVRESEPVTTGSASEKKIVIRDIGQTVDVTLAGESYPIKSSAYFIWYLVREIRFSAAVKLKPIAEDFNKAMIGLLAKKENLTEDDVVSFYNETNDKKRIAHDEGDMALRKSIQLIIFDIKRPEWRKTAETMPSDEELDSIIPMKTLLREATIEEINNLLSIYDQMNNVEEPRQNFFKMTGTAML